MKRSLSIRPPIIVSIAMLLLAIFPFPYGYYILLRLVVCSTAAYLSWLSYKRQSFRWVWIMGFIVLLFNPLIPISLGKGLWLFMDLAIAIVFGIFLFRNKQEG